MDTISRENNSVLPIVGVGAGVLALILAAVALVKISSAKTDLTKLIDDNTNRVSAVESQVSSSAATVEQTRNLANRLQTDTQNAFTAVAEQLGAIRGEVAKVQEALTKAPKAAAGGSTKAAAVAGPGEYIVKKGDLPSKIAKANGVSVEALKAANPNVAWNRLAIGQKIKLPTK